MAIIPLKGSIIQESTLNTRNAPKPSPNFLHFSENVELDAEHHIQKVGGADFDPEKIYSVAIYQFLLTGLNVIEPLMSYVTEHVKVPDVEQCRPVKDIVLEQCMKEEWRALIDFDSMDKDGDGGVSAEELRAGVEKVIQAMDANNDGMISKEELTKVSTHEERPIGGRLWRRPLVVRGVWGVASMVMQAGWLPHARGLASQRASSLFPTRLLATSLTSPPPMIADCRYAPVYRGERRQRRAGREAHHDTRCGRRRAHLQGRVYDPPLLMTHVRLHRMRSLARMRARRGVCHVVGYPAICDTQALRERRWAETNNFS